jgi:CubicO group peptidase (beta-lactamase class C family)
VPFLISGIIPIPHHSVTPIIPSSPQSLQEAFERNFRERGEIGASVSVFRGDAEIINLSEGHTTRERTQPWTSDTLVPVWSATKGPAAVACLCALDDASVPLDSPVREIWPQFAGGGKDKVTLLQVLTHTAGLSALDEPTPIEDYDAVIHALERQKPLFPPGTRQGYHARTFGFLLEEIARRITGAGSFGRYFRERLADPMNLDFWIGLPAEQLPRVATLYPGKLRPGAAQTPFMQAFNSKGSVTQRTFASPSGLNAVQDLNNPETLARGYASMGGVGSARALASFYAMLANGGTWHGRQLVSESVLKALQTSYSQQEDAVLCAPMAFGAGVMRDPLDASGNKIQKIFGSGRSAFGHPGAGGSLAFADPERRLSFAYVMNQMELGALPGEKTLSLVEAIDGVL